MANPQRIEEMETSLNEMKEMLDELNQVDTNKQGYEDLTYKQTVNDMYNILNNYVTHYKKLHAVFGEMNKL